MKNVNVIFLVIVISISIACGNKTNTTADIEANKQLIEKWDEAFNKGDLDALQSIYTSDAIRMQPNEPVFNGQEGIRASFKSYLDQNETMHDENKVLDVTITGEYAIVSGTYTSDYKPKTSANPVHDEGKWICIQKRQADGSWKITMDIWNSDLPPVDASE